MFILDRQEPYGINDPNNIIRRNSWNWRSFFEKGNSVGFFEDIWKICEGTVTKFDFSDESNFMKCSHWVPRPVNDFKNVNIPHRFYLCFCFVCLFVCELYEKLSRFCLRGLFDKRCIFNQLVQTFRDVSFSMSEIQGWMNLTNSRKTYFFIESWKLQKYPRYK